MTLEINRLTNDVQAMGQALTMREHQYARLIDRAQEWLDAYAPRAAELQEAARRVRAAVPTGEPINASHALPRIPDTFTFIAADGSQIQPDRHTTALYHLINIGSLVYRHGSGQAPEPRSHPQLGYDESDIYEDGLLVAGNLLDVRRDIAEITELADLCAAEDEPETTVAAVDGTLILWVLEDLPAAGRDQKINQYLSQLHRIRRCGASVCAFVSRPRHADVARLLHLAHVEGDAERVNQEESPLAHLPDRAIFGHLPGGARSSLFVDSRPINQRYYRPEGQTVYFCYLNLATADEEPVIARVEMPLWVAEDADRLALIHAALVAQARITGDYPYALARADELAFISGPERNHLTTMINTALLRAGSRRALSPKQYQKSRTRGGR